VPSVPRSGLKKKKRKKRKEKKGKKRKEKKNLSENIIYLARVSL
jgi:hypothetical protein